MREPTQIKPGRSLRATLQLWNALLVVAVVGVFGGLTYFGARHARWAQADTELRADAEVVAAQLRPARRRMVFGDPFSGDFGPPPGGDHRRDGRDNSGGPDSADQRGPRLELPEDVSRRFEGGPAGGSYLAVFRFADAPLLASSRAPADVPAPAPAPSAEMFGRGFGGGPPDRAFEPAFEPYFRQRGDLREVIVSAPFGTRVVVGRSVAPLRAELRTLAGWTAAGGLGVIALGLAGGWLLARRAVRPIEAITATARRITAANLSDRIDPAGAHAELAGLAAVLNGTFGRLESAFERQARFTADASHELRTPISVVHARAELALSRDRSPEEYRDALQVCLRASRRMRTLVESLLLLARADAGRMELRREPFDLAEIAEESADLLKSLAAEKGVTVHLDVQPLPLTGDGGRIGQCATNLLANAITYNLPGGRVDVSVRPDGSEAVLEVADTGVGIADADRPHLFERFFRADKSRARGPSAGGNGLGLAICKSIVESHGGRISVAGNNDGGSTFTVRLPREAPVELPEPERVPLAASQ